MVFFILFLGRFDSKFQIASVVNDSGLDTWLNPLSFFYDHFRKVFGCEFFMQRLFFFPIWKLISYPRKFDWFCISWGWFLLWFMKSLTGTPAVVGRNNWLTLFHLTYGTILSRPVKHLRECTRHSNFQAFQALIINFSPSKSNLWSSRCQSEL